MNLAANAPSGARVFTLDLPPDWGRRYSLDVADIHFNAATGKHTGRQFIDSRQSDRITQLWEIPPSSIGMTTAHSTSS